MLHHVALPDAYLAGHAYTPADYEQDGFIHLCTPDQLQTVLDTYYKDIRPLHLLYLNGDISDVKWEAASSGELFPHLYRPIEVEDVVQVEALNDIIVHPVPAETQADH